MAVDETSSGEFTAGQELLLRTISLVVISLGMSIIAFGLGWRTKSAGFFNHGTTVVGRMSLFLLLVLALLSFIYSGVLILGIGLSLNKRTCSASLTGGLLLLFVAGGIRTLVLSINASNVWLKTSSQKTSKIAILGSASMTLTILMVAVGLYGRYTHLGIDGKCKVGLKQPIAILLLALDLAPLLLLSIAFLIPILKRDPHVRRTSWINLAATLVYLIISLLNLGAVTLLNGREFGWVFMVSSNVAVGIQAILAIWIIEPSSKSNIPDLPLARTGSQRRPPDLILAAHSPTTTSTFSPITSFGNAIPLSPKLEFPRKEAAGLPRLEGHWTGLPQAVWNETGDGLRIDANEATSLGSAGLEERLAGMPQAVWNENGDELKEDSKDVVPATPPHRRRRLSKPKKRSRSRGEDSSMDRSTKVSSTKATSTVDLHEDLPPNPSFPPYLFRPYQAPPLPPLANPEDDLIPPLPHTAPVVANPRRASPAKRRPSNHPFISSEPNLSKSVTNSVNHRYHYQRQASSTSADPVLPNADLPMHSNLRKTPYPFGQLDDDIDGPRNGRGRENSRGGLMVGGVLSGSFLGPRRPSEWDPAPRPEWVGAGGNGFLIRDAVANYVEGVFEAEDEER